MFIGMSFSGLEPTEGGWNASTLYRRSHVPSERRLKINHYAIRRLIVPTLTI
jgi:hypothetical protein